MFKYIDFETSSLCNQRCPTCIRNSHPDRQAVKSWFEMNLLPIGVIDNALNQCAELGFTGGVCLSHYNEPLLDNRIAMIAHLAKSYGRFSPIFLHTNGNFLTKELATTLDGALDKIYISFYDKHDLKKKAGWTESLFDITKVQNLTMSEHVPTHFSPKFDIEKLIKERSNRLCREPTIRVIINHRRQYLLCCDDVIGNFGLGTFPEISIKDYWFGAQRTRIEADLLSKEGRYKYDYCRSCPRP